MKYQKGFASLVIILMGLLAITVLGGGYVYYKDQQKIQDLGNTVQNSQNSDTNTNKTAKILDQNSYPILSVQAGLPPLVEVKRQAIYKAAMSRDLNKLKVEVDASASDTLYGFDINGKSPNGQISGYTKYWKEQTNISIFDLIPKLLKLPYSVSDPTSLSNYVYNRWTTENKKEISSNNVMYYTWPSVVTKQPKDWTASDIANMKTFLTDGEIELMRGGWSYFNIVITSDGRWIYPSGQGD